MRAVGLIQLLTVLVTVFSVNSAKAQSNTDDFMDDDEPFDEAVEDKGLQQGQGSRSRGPSIPAFNKNNVPGPNAEPRPMSPPPNPIFSKPGDVSFQLVTPAKVRPPKKRRHRSREADLKQAEVRKKNESAPRPKPTPQ
jgi:hypothetical protein